MRSEHSRVALCAAATSPFCLDNPCALMDSMLVGWKALRTWIQAEVSRQLGGWSSGEVSKQGKVRVEIGKQAYKC